MGYLVLLFAWWIVTLLGIGSIVAAEPLWKQPCPEDDGNTATDPRS